MATLTEAIYGLIVEKEVPLSKIILMTTLKGKESFYKSDLYRPFGSYQEVIRQMAKHYEHRLPRGWRSDEILVPEVMVVRDSNGIELEDIRDEDENSAVAIWMLQRVSELASDPNLVIHASVAGGRKTMAIFLKDSLELFGRREDKVYHVLVSANHERPGYYYPFPIDLPDSEAIQEIPSRDEKNPPISVDARQMKVDMAELSYIRLRDLFRKETLRNLQLQLKRRQIGMDEIFEQADLGVRVISYDYFKDQTEGQKWHDPRGLEESLGESAFIGIVDEFANNRDTYQVWRWVRESLDPLIGADDYTDQQLRDAQFAYFCGKTFLRWGNQNMDSERGVEFPAICLRAFIEGLSRFLNIPAEFDPRDPMKDFGDLPHDENCLGMATTGKCRFEDTIYALRHWLSELNQQGAREGVSAVGLHLKAPGAGLPTQWALDIHFSQPFPEPVWSESGTGTVTSAWSSLRRCFGNGCDPILKGDDRTLRLFFGDAQALCT